MGKQNVAHPYNNEAQIQATTWMNLTNIMVSEISESQRTFTVFLYM